MNLNLTARVFTIFLMITLVLTGIQVMNPAEDAEAQFTPDVNVYINPATIYVDVSPQGTGIGNALATATNEGIHTVTCEMNVICEGYDTSPMQFMFTLGPGMSRDVTVGIVAMLRDPYTAKTGTVVVEVKSVDGVQVPEYWENTAGFTVMTKYYGRLILEASSPLIKVWPGKEGKMKFDVYNRGNADDEVMLEINNKAELYDAGFSFSLSTSGSTIIPAGNKTRMTIHYTTPKSTYENKYYTVDVSAISSYDNALSMDYSVTIWVRGVYVPGFEPISAMFALILMGVFLSRKRPD